MTAFTFDDVATHLGSLHAQGVLAPFIGSGMSRNRCKAWKPFLLTLAARARVDLNPTLSRELADPDAKVDTGALYRLADEVVAALRPLPRETRRGIYCDALVDTSGAVPAIPPQTSALANIYWPLVLTTNYDDLYWSARAEKSIPSYLVEQGKIATKFSDH
jgi:hypothetical protein